jgi:hypothetical protein
MRALIAHGMGDQTTAEKWLSAAKTLLYADDALNLQWVALGDAVIGDDLSALPLLLPDPSQWPLQPGTPLAVAMYRGQFQRDSLAVEYPPQVGYEFNDPLLVRLITQAAENETSTETAAAAGD